MRARAPLLVAAVGFVLVLGLSFLFVLPRVRAVGEARDRLEQAQQRQVSLEAEVARLLQARDGAAEVRRELARIRREVPPVADLPGLINQLQDAADASAVEFFSISPGDPLVVDGASAARFTTEIRINGDFFAVDEFLFRLETMSRAAKVISVAISPFVRLDTEEGGAAPAPEDTASETFEGLSVTLSVEFYTKDLTAGPGAVVEPQVSPEVSPSPGTSPSPGETTSPSAVTSPTPTEGT